MSTIVSRASCGHVEVRGRRDLAGDDAQARREQRLARDAPPGVLGEHGVEHGVGDLVGDLVGVPLGDGLGREDGSVAIRLLAARRRHTLSKRTSATSRLDAERDVLLGAVVAEDHDLVGRRGRTRRRASTRRSRRAGRSPCAQASRDRARPRRSVSAAKPTTTWPARRRCDDRGEDVVGRLEGRPSARRRARCSFAVARSSSGGSRRPAAAMTTTSASSMTRQHRVVQLARRLDVDGGRRAAVDDRVERERRRRDERRPSRRAARRPRRSRGPGDPTSGS